MDIEVDVVSTSGHRQLHGRKEYMQSTIQMRLFKFNPFFVVTTTLVSV